ncbi:MAG TPA: methyltransferase domain-containing protein [Candidatus Nanoarchaeia archaeon]|nr:methyltransferase domain-containing protein [Candidatus Nanoarchaeia archaeon]
MMPEEKEVIKKYAMSAEAYHSWRTKENPQGWFYNELLEMPSTISLLGDIKGKKILDLGCGTGIYARLLTKMGAKVKGFDISKEMLNIAKIDNPNLDLRLGSAYKIPFKEKFDIVLASLVVHYLKDWDKMFKEINMVLKNKGVFVFSTGNPVAEARKKIKVGKKKISVLDDYFKEGKIYGHWRGNKVKDMRMFSYHKTYETIIKTIIKNGFKIIDYKDCFPIKKAKKLFPKDYAEYSKKPFFCVWKVMKK